MTTRRYNQRLRAKAAEETRQRILDALYTTLRSSPAEPVRVERLAKEAGVSRSTVYTVFGSRAGLFDALGSRILSSAGFDQMVAQVLQPDPVQGLRDGIRANVQMYAAHRDVLRSLYSMAQLDGEAVGGAVRRLELGREHGMRDLAERLSTHEALREGSDQRDAFEVLWLATGFDSFDLLYTGQNLGVERTTARLVEIAERALLTGM